MPACRFPPWQPALVRLPRERGSWMQPKAREKELLVREVEGEVVVYDQARHRVHTLNPSARAVWRHCDGNSTIPEITAKVESELDRPVGEDFVLHAISSLRKARLLETESVPEMTATLCSRRD